MIQEPIQDVIEGWLLRNPGPEKLNKKQSLQELRSWLFRHSITWWPEDDRRRTELQKADKTPVDNEVRALVESAVACVHPESSTAVAQSRGLHRTVWDSLKPELETTSSEAVQNSEQKRRRDRLRDMIPSRLSRCMAKKLSENTEFLETFASTQDPMAHLKPFADEAAKQCRQSTIEQAKNDFLGRETLRQALTLPDDETLIRLLSDAESRAGMDPRNWTKGSLHQIRKALRELSDGRYQSEPDRLRDVPHWELRSRALDCLVRGEPGQWMLPVQHETALGTVIMYVRSWLLKRARQDRVPDPDNVVSDIQESLVEKVRRHSVREYLASGRFPSKESISAWARAAADKQFSSIAGRQRLRETSTDPAELPQRSATSLPGEPVVDIGEAEDIPFSVILRAEFREHLKLYKTDEVLQAAINFVTSGRQEGISDLGQLVPALRAACPDGVDPELVTQLFFASLNRLNQGDYAGLAFTSDYISYGGGS